ncbi:hypothetical protein Patl1_27447 [Pistacia atlantica]|uniref:Uncharacterized protein n=1 Tax=Pistacia atlantica TaxID=434234 RepID=A0ACC1BFG8_9ROSI|nr:hypothetical protein Patl1_27447 [Pistacia atlantica]
MRSLCSSLSAVPSDDDSSSSLPPQLPPFDYQPKPYLGPSAEQLNIVEGKILYVFDESGMQYLDAFAGIVTVSCGHCHPDIVVYFVNSGTEANELAMLMARLYSGNLGMVALRNAYHGGSSNTIGLTVLNTWK